MGLQVDVETAVSRLGQIDFLQPLFEAVTNSLEANADEIDISVSVGNSQLPLHLPNSGNETQIYKISGFTVTDNGEGFTPANVQSFKTLWSKAKIKLGCKGAGRLTWLKVFKKVKIESRLKTSNVVIDFDENFSEANVKETQEPNTDKTSTRVTFSDVLPSFLPAKKDGKSKDKREDGDIEEVCKKIKQYLLVKLALLKEQKRDFHISVTLGKECRSITKEDIPDLTQNQFSITGYQGCTYDFILLYGISKDELNQKQAYYCANGRTVSEISNDVSFLKDINVRDSIIMFLTSQYLDERINDERNKFMIEPNEETLTEPISFSSINDMLKNEIGEILLTYYSETKKQNNEAVESAIKEQPFLASYIREDKSFIKTEKQLIKNARKAFEKQKQETSKKFSDMLKQKNIDPKTFNETVEQVKQVAFQELGEYILYRQQIIDALNKALEDKEKKEKYIHDLIMPMKSASDDHADSVVERGYATNLWLLDDKYMTYSYAASDKTVKQITEVITQNYAKYKSAVRPDIAVFFNRSSNSKDVIVCELKGAHASVGEKNKSITELPNDIGIIRKNIEDINRVWGYIITEIDDDFKSTIEWQDFKPLFTNNENGNLYFKYLAKANAYITILDLRTLIADASARNKLFLEILSR